jgi:hypothetical protein
MAFELALDTLEVVELAVDDDPQASSSLAIG